MKERFLIALTLSFAGSAALANAQIQCDEEITSEHRHHQRFEIEINEKNQLVSMQDINWNDRTNSQAGLGANGYHGSKPLKAIIEKDRLVYKFTTQNEGDGDYPGPATEVTVNISKLFSGTAEVAANYANYKNGKSEIEIFDLNCK